MTGPPNQGDAMTPIQEQVEQFIIDWLPDRQECPDEEDYFEHLGRYRKEAKAEMIEILRAFLEECCEVSDRYHADGLTELIKEHFAWLEEK